MVKVAYRAQQIVIDSIKPEIPEMVMLTLQRLELDDENNILAITSHKDGLYKKVCGSRNTNRNNKRSCNRTNTNN